MAQPLLEGGSSYPDLYDDRDNLRKEISRLTLKNHELDGELRLERIRAQSLESGAKELKQVLTPLYRALQKVFGDFEDMGIVETVPLGGAPQFDPKWTAWMDKLGHNTAPAKVIRAILDHGPINRSQLRQAAGIGWSTLDAATSRLKNLSLIEKSGDRWNLKG